MGKSKRLWVPIEPYDIEAIKEWLEEKAREGYELKNMKPYFAVFEETERQELKYHLEPTLKDTLRPMDDILESRKERGWSYAGTVTDHFHVFRSPAGTKEFHADEHAVRWKLEEKLKRDKRKLLWKIPLFFYVFILQMGFWDLFHNPAIWIIEGLSLIHLLAFIPLVLGVISQYLNYRHHKRAVERMAGNVEDYPESNENFRVLGLVGQVLVYLALIVVGLSIIFEVGSAKDMGSMGKIDQYPFIHIEEIELGEDPSISEAKFVKYNYYSGSTSSIFVKERLYLNQYANIGHVEHYSSDLSSVYYELRLKKATEVLAREARNRAKERSGAEGETEMLHGFSITYYEGINVQYLILNDADQLLELTYYGDADLSEWKEEFTGKLESYKSTQH